MSGELSFTQSRDLCIVGVMFVGGFEVRAMMFVLQCSSQDVAWGRDEKLGSSGNKRVLLEQLKRCQELEHGRLLHAAVARSEDPSNLFLATALISMYGKCGSMVEARQVFDRIAHPDVVSWNSLILGYAENGQGNMALLLFAWMLHEGLAPTSVSFVAALKAYLSLKVRDERKVLAFHCQAASRGMELEFHVRNTLLDAYSKSHSLGCACRVFRCIEDPTAVNWNTMMFGYVENGEEHLALETFAQMQSMGLLADELGFAALFSACAGLAKKGKGLSFETGHAIHNQAARLNLDFDIQVQTTIMDMYAKCGSMAEAQRVFNAMEHPDVVPWTSLIMGYADNEQGALSLQLFAVMQSTPDAQSYLAGLKACTALLNKQVSTVPLERCMALHTMSLRAGYYSNVFVACSLVDVYAKAGKLSFASKVFETTDHRDAVPWNALIQGYTDNNHAEEALQLFRRMQKEAVQANAVTFLAALKACSALSSLELGKWIHGKIRELNLEKDVLVASSLVDFYGRCGCMGDAQQVFDSLGRADLVTCNALMSGYSRQGDVDSVLRIFSWMKEKEVDTVTITCVLATYSHAGMVEKGKECFETMLEKHGVTPSLEHWTCMVDMLGRADQVDKAVAMVKRMPDEYRGVGWKTLLAACSKWRNMEIGRLAFDSLQQSDPAAIVLMSNMYAS